LHRSKLEYGLAHTTSSRLKVAIFYGPMVPMGGAERVTLAMVDTVSSAGLDVDLYVGKGFRLDELAHGFGMSARGKYRVRMIVSSRLPRAAFHRGGAYLDIVKGLIEKKVDSCDLLIDMAPTHYGANYFRIPDLVYWNVAPTDLSFVCRGENRVAVEVYLHPFRRLLEYFVKRWRLVKVHVANSLYTRRTIIDRLDNDLAPIVIYPPVDIRSWSAPVGNAERRRGIVSLARFEIWKRHDLQLLMMRGLRAKLRMIGRAVTESELSNLQRLKETAKKNADVEFHVNLPHVDVKRVLQSSKVFVHTADAEPFGMSVVEAIASGCVPVVRDAGAMPEIVPIEELRFETIEEGRETTKRALGGEYDRLLPELRTHIQRFDEQIFRKDMMKCVSEILRHQIR
jgi:glycosyltransferase involved in cell wall biosynthesis